MLALQVPPQCVTNAEYHNIGNVISELKICSSTKNLQRGKSIHESVIKSGYISNVYIASTLINMYGKCGNMENARRVFETLKDPDVVCWTALIWGYAEAGETQLPLELFSNMRFQECIPDVRTCIAALMACINIANSGHRVLGLRCGKQLHLFALQRGFDSDSYLGCTVIDMFSKCGRIEDAQRVFHSMRNRNVVAWNALILGYVDNGKGDDALELFTKMESDGCVRDSRSFVAAFKACTNLAVEKYDNVKYGSKGKALHLLACRVGCYSDIYVKNTLVDMYSNTGNLVDARKVFDSIQQHNAISTNALLMGYVENGMPENALDLYSRMSRETCIATDRRNFLAALKACTVLAENEEGIVKLRSRRKGIQVHLLVLMNGGDSDVYIGSALVDMYAKCGCMKDARGVFDGLKHRNVVCWTALLMGYIDHGEGETCLRMFQKMGREGCEPNAATFVAALKASSMVGSLDIGTKIHAEIKGRGLQVDAILLSSLLDLYISFGNMIEAQEVFDAHVGKDMVTWNVLMAGYSHHGRIAEVFNLLDKMIDAGLNPDAVTFGCVLAACNHAGLLDKARHYFEVMTTNYGVQRELEHYTCMADILGRASRLDEAMVLLRTMPCTPDAVAWTTMVYSCRRWKNVELGRLAFESLMSLDRRETGAYVLMANMFQSDNIEV